jgi:EAL domain-containing protein (putative c-di-GMP-specific phosphodiesterase class I)
MQLLGAVRSAAFDLPVILMTGSPELSTAIKAVELGAFAYLVKPVETDAMLETVTRANVFHRLARLKRDALELVSGGGMGAADRVGLEIDFERAVASMWMAYQPIIQVSTRTLFGYEALMRSEEKSLPHPGAVLDAAERLGRMQRLGRRVRTLAAEGIAGAGADCALFVNIHATDLSDEALLAPDSPLGAIAGRVVLEITERASLDQVADPKGRIASLRKLGFRIAVDDLGAGYAGLTSFALLEPEIIKLDMSLVRGIDSSAVKQKLVRSMISVCRDLGIQAVAEGIETHAERDTIVSLGCDFLQGYLFAKPGKPFPPFAWG